MFRVSMEQAKYSFLHQVHIYLLPFCESKEDFLSLEALMSEEMVQK